jgi:hypothetical protein
LKEEITEDLALSSLALVESQLDTEGLVALEIFMTYSMSMCVKQIEDKLTELANDRV